MDDLALEQLAARAWPATEAVERDGWLLRHTPALDRWRNTSGLPLRPDATLAAMEAFFAERGAAPVVQVGPAHLLEGLDAELERAGYEHRMPVDVMTAAAAAVPPAVPGGAAVRGLAAPSEAWMAAWVAGEGRDDAAAHAGTVFALLNGRATYLLAEDGAGQALVVRDGEWGGIFCMAVVPEQRGRGVARALLAAAAALAPRLYLQVVPGNAAAQALYRGSGFTRRYGYHFRLGARP